MTNMPVFRRLSDAEVSRFAPWYKLPALKIGWAILLLIVGMKWVMK